MNCRYAFGGDEHMFVEVDEAMSLEAFFVSLAITNTVREAAIDGRHGNLPRQRVVPDQVRSRPDPSLTADGCREGDGERLREGTDSRLDTRIIEIPVYYQDPWTHETLMRFRERHQDPDSTDIEYAARINGYGDVGAFIEAHSGAPWFVSMVGFVSGLPFLYQMVDRPRQIQVPKYLRPRTDTPKLTVGYGGCFSCIYSVRGAGGYQMFGITPMPIYDPEQQVNHLRDFMVFFRPGDIVKWAPIDRAAYDAAIEAVAEGTFEPRVRSVTFDLDEFNADIDGTNARLTDALHGD